MRKLIDLAIELRVSERRRTDAFVVVADNGRSGRMSINPCLDQFLKSHVIRKRGFRSVELSDLCEIAARGGRWVSGHETATETASSSDSAGLIDKNLPQHVFMDLGGAFNDLH